MEQEKDPSSRGSLKGVQASSVDIRQASSVDLRQV